MDGTISNMMDQVKAFCEARDWDQFHNPKDLAIGISTEANELLALFRFQSAKQMETQVQDPNRRTRIEEELADVLFFTLRFAQMNQMDPVKCLEDKLKGNTERYPVEKAKGKNLKYTDL